MQELCLIISRMSSAGSEVFGLGMQNQADCAPRRCLVERGFKQIIIWKQESGRVPGFAEQNGYCNLY